MADDRNPRPVSGEIMASAAEPKPARPAGDVLDAEYETLEGTETAGQPAARRTLQAPALGMDSLKADAPETRSRRGERAGPLFWICGVVFAAAAFWVSGGHALAPAMPLAGFQRAAEPVRITAFESRIETVEGRAMLAVDGEAVNESGEAVALRPLGIKVTGADGTVTRYALGPGGRVLDAGERYTFSTRLDVPPGGVGSVAVSFVE